uniref:Ixodegrin B n=1 Tax=Rhipicephalus appendiculatus TaxID=34631 RepID=A0A131YED5_RHIAP
MELASHTCHLYIVLLLIPLIFALPPGFDSQVLPYFASGYRSLTLGAVCASTSQCPQGTCCLNSRPGGPVCRPAAVMGAGCHPHAAIRERAAVYHREAVFNIDCNCGN